ncbi:cell wall / vacuolar inhibitor of fructosidase [Salix suchowensis]|nr:cell wall / vacuolar inhibitor of fructosidase [Salix suchowensis]
MIPSLFPVLLLLLISTSQCSATSQHKQPDLIEKSCSIIAGYEDCVRILRSDRRAIKATNVKELAYIILDLCIANATVTLGEVPKLREKYKKYGKIEKALRRCAAVEQLGKKSYLEAQNLAHIGGALGTSCEQEFYFQAPEYSPLWPRNHDLAVLGTVAEGIVSLLRLKKS